MKKIILVTPSYRIVNLKKILKSIDFSYIEKWIIIYDGSKMDVNFQLFSDNNKIIEYTDTKIIYSVNKKYQSGCGNTQRNYALDYINKIYLKEPVFIYFLDDDNIIHPNFYNIIQKIEYNKFYTFDQLRNDGTILSGNNIKAYKIDTAMFLCDFNLVRDIKFVPENEYDTDWRYIESCYKKNIKSHIYVPEIGCYYNYLRWDQHETNKVRTIN